MKKLIIAAGVVVSLGLVSQVVEHSMDEERIKEVVTTRLHETNDKEDEEFIDFSENSVVEWLGF
ncbi:hypothetical protein NRIC_11130 [Enterococcus florum]|uniref:Uncharacterized protein n=1 Tax=Enterococcus florum TaxID=2480627 RepID=A0A4P5PCN7_9ENTE|nr:hypothetical protein [Enterococcus florum]GCF93222.1 hypothetical protein NRIC_11130 [Enterococcus florum]